MHFASDQPQPARTRPDAGCAGAARGFTVIELMMTLTVAAILLSIGVPSFTDMIRRTRLSSTMSQLTSDLYAAKGEAIKRNMRVLVCAKTPSPTHNCTASTDWASGWMVCFDADANGSCDTSTAANPNPLIVQEAIHDSLALTGPSTPLAFTSTGPAVAAATLTLTGAWTDAPSKQTSVALTGFIGTN